MYSFNARRNEASPNRMSLDRHSCRIEHTQRSAKAFKFGLLDGRVNGRMPLERRNIQKLRAELGVAIMKNVLLASKKTGTFVGGITSDLNHPFGSWMLG